MTSQDVGREPKNDNPDLARMHSELVALVTRLEKSIDLAPTAAAIGAISDQIIEVNARTTAAGRLLLVERSDEIARLARRVSVSIPKIEDDIQDLDRLDRLVRSVAGVLDAADATIEAATLLAR